MSVQELRKVVQQSIEALSLQYSDLVSTSEPLWLQSLDTIALRHVCFLLTEAPSSWGL